MVFQHKLFLNLFKDFFKKIEGLRRSVNIGEVPEEEWIVDLAVLRRKWVIGCQISRSKLYKMFKRILFFNLVNGLIN